MPAMKRTEKEVSERAYQVAGVLNRVCCVFEATIADIKQAVFESLFVYQFPWVTRFVRAPSFENVFTKRDTRYGTTGVRLGFVRFLKLNSGVMLGIIVKGNGHGALVRQMERGRQ